LHHVSRFLLPTSRTIKSIQIYKKTAHWNQPHSLFWYVARVEPVKQRDCRQRRRRLLVYSYILGLVIYYRPATHWTRGVHRREKLRSTAASTGLAEPNSPSRGQGRPHISPIPRQKEALPRSACIRSRTHTHTQSQTRTHSMHIKDSSRGCIQDVLTLPHALVV